MDIFPKLFKNEGETMSIFDHIYTTDVSEANFHGIC